MLISLGSIALITLVNLRGLSESSKIFGVPTYAFILAMGALIVVGFVRMVSGSLPPIEYTACSERRSAHSVDVWHNGISVPKGVLLGLFGAVRRGGGLKRHSQLPGAFSAQRPGRAVPAGRDFARLIWRREPAGVAPEGDAA